VKQNKSAFKWLHFEPTIILLCFRWYCHYQLSYRDVEEMMRQRGLDMDHSTIFRWVQRYAPEINTSSGAKYLNNVIGHDHRFIKKKVRASNASSRSTSLNELLKALKP